MAEGDLYFIEGEKTFAENYFKSAFGLWCRLVIVIGIAVTLSTYLAAMIAVFGTMLLYGVAYIGDFVQDIGTRSNVGGGPFEASLRMMRGETPTMPLEPTGAMRAVSWGDDVYAWFFRRFFNVIPDVDAFSWADFLAEGYNVNFEYLIINIVILVGYLLPWAVLAYYLIAKPRSGGVAKRAHYGQSDAEGRPAAADHLLRTHSRVAHAQSVLARQAPASLRRHGRSARHGPASGATRPGFFHRSSAVISPLPGSVIGFPAAPS